MTEEVIMLGGNAIEALRGYMERIVKLEQDKAALAADVRDIYKDAKGNGFDNKAMRVLARRLLKDSFEDEQDLAAMVDIYQDRLFGAPTPKAGREILDDEELLGE